MVAIGAASGIDTRLFLHRPGVALALPGDGRLDLIPSVGNLARRANTGTSLLASTRLETTSAEPAVGGFVHASVGLGCGKDVETQKLKCGLEAAVARQSLATLTSSSAQTANVAHAMLPAFCGESIETATRTERQSRGPGSAQWRNQFRCVRMEVGA